MTAHMGMFEVKGQVYGFMAVLRPLVRIQKPSRPASWMMIIGKSRLVRAAALRLSSANRRSSPDTSPAGTECLDIFSPPPGDRDVISQVLRDSSSETKIAPSAVRIAACV